MALSLRNFTRAATAVTTGPGVHSYRTADDDVADVVASGYFNDLAKITEGPQIAAFDFIMVSAADGPCIVHIDTISAGVVSVTQVAPYVAP